MSLRHQVERAFSRVVEQISGKPADLKVYRGADFATQQVPCVVCWCKGGEETPEGSGNRMMQVTIIVKSSAVEGDKPDASDLNPVANLEALSTLVFNALKVGDINSPSRTGTLADLLTKAVSGLTVFHPVIETGYDPDLAEFSFLDTMTFQVYCCEAQLTP